MILIVNQAVTGRKSCEHQARRRQVAGSITHTLHRLPRIGHSVIGVRADKRMPDSLGNGPHCSDDHEAVLKNMPLVHGIQLINRLCRLTRWCRRLPCLSRQGTGQEEKREKQQLGDILHNTLHSVSWAVSYSSPAVGCQFVMSPTLFTHLGPGKLRLILVGVLLAAPSSVCCRRTVPGTVTSGRRAAWVRQENYNAKNVPRPERQV